MSFAVHLPAARRALHESRGEWPHPDLTTLLERRVRDTPERVLFVADDRRVTALDVFRGAEQLAAGLAALGIEAGDVVAWQLPNWIEAVYLTFALDRLGAVSAPLLPIYRGREVGFICRQTNARVLIVPGVLRGFDHRLLAATAQRDARVEHVLVARADPGPGQRSLDRLLDAPAGHAPSPTPPGPHDVACVFYTSGTTAEPKGVLHTPSTLGALVATGRLVNETEADDVALVSFPVTHLGGIAFGVALPVVHGSCVVFLDPFDPERALQLIEREGVTNAGGPPAVLQAILRAPAFHPERVRTVRKAGLGAADVSPVLMRMLAEELGWFVYRSYGLTECPMATAGRRADAPEKLVATDGRPVPGVAIRVVDERGCLLGSDVEGEIELFGPQLCVGYLDAARSAEAFLADGFIRSGDLGIIDGAGFLRITGRKKDIIIRKGENLSAKAIEDELHAHPRIADAAVIGIPDPERGERVCACVVPRQDGAPPLTLDDVRAFMLARQVMVQKIPEQLELLEALPRNAMGKVLKHELRQRLGGRGSA